MQYFKQNKKRFSSQRCKPVFGFTLIEVLVSVALFSMVMVVALGALLSMSISIRKAESINSSINNLSSALDAISRAIRTGSYYHCGSITGQDCQSTPNSFFTYLASDAAASQVTYCLSKVSPISCLSTTVCPSGESCIILRSISTQNSGAYTALTSAEMQIKFFGFYVVGSIPGSPDNLQPKVTIVISGIVPVTATTFSEFNLQTSVTQQAYDL